MCPTSPCVSFETTAFQKQAWLSAGTIPVNVNDLDDEVNQGSRVAQGSDAKTQSVFASIRHLSPPVFRKKQKFR